MTLDAGWLERELEDASGDFADWPDWLKPADGQTEESEEDSTVDPFTSE
jgi:hypothetical protein